MGEFDARGNPAKQTTFTDPAAILEDGAPARGQVLSSRGNNTVVRFDIFPRDRSELALRISDVTETLKFTVKNPRPVARATWTTYRLPLTNILAGTRIELRGLVLKNSPVVGAAEIKPLVWAFAQGSGSLGWMRWRFTAANADGNWTMTAWDPAPKIPLLLPTGSPWNLTVEAEEYLSAGFVTEPASGNWSVLSANTRAREMGFRAAILLAPGAYRISSREGSGEIDVSPAVLPLQSLALSGPVDGTNWIVQVNTPRMGIVCLTELDLGVAGIRLRLRERDRRNSPNTGTAHPSLISMSTTNTVAASGRRLAAQFFIPRWTQTQEVWPRIDGQIEAEVIVSHSPAQFVVDPTMASPPPARRAAPF